jgi:hypothetical protein
MSALLRIAKRKCNIKIVNAVSRYFSWEFDNLVDSETQRYIQRKLCCCVGKRCDPKPKEQPGKYPRQRTQAGGTPGSYRCSLAHLPRFIRHEHDQISPTLELISASPPNGATMSMMRRRVPLFHSTAASRLSPASIRLATRSSASAHSAMPTGCSPL